MALYLNMYQQQLSNNIKCKEFHDGNWTCFLTSWNPGIVSLGKETNWQLLPPEARRLQVHLCSLQPCPATPASPHENQAVWGYTIKECINIKPGIQGGMKPISSEVSCNRLLISPLCQNSTLFTALLVQAQALKRSQCNVCCRIGSSIQWSRNIWNEARRTSFTAIRPMGFSGADGIFGANASKETSYRMGKKNLGASYCWGQKTCTCPREWWSLDQAQRSKAKEGQALAEQNLAPWSFPTNHTST